MSFRVLLCVIASKPAVWFGFWLSAKMSIEAATVNASRVAASPICRRARPVSTTKSVLKRWRELGLNIFMAEPSREELLARIAELERQAGQRKSAGALSFKVSDKGAVSVYGMGRFPVTLYYEQWLRLLGAADELRTFLEENKGKLKLKDEV